MAAEVYLFKIDNGQPVSMAGVARSENNPIEKARCLPLLPSDHVEGGAEHVASCVSYLGNSTAYARKGPGLPRFSGGSNNVAS